MIEPFITEKRKDKGPSYGLSSAGYDAQLDNRFWIAKPGYEAIDIANPPPPEDIFEEHVGDSITLMPGMFVLLVTKEYFRIPQHIIGRCTGKSTLRRLGLINDMTPLEPGWEGRLVVELNFTFPRPVILHAGMGICQIVFEKMEAECRDDYAASGGKYMHQQGITAAKV
jgi:deoxycytidine triphosphate deaminase